MTSNYILQSSLTSVLFNQYQRGFFLQQTETKTKIHSQTLHRKSDVEQSALNGISPSNASNQSSGKPEEE